MNTQFKYELELTKIQLNRKEIYQSNNQTLYR